MDEEDRLLRVDEVAERLRVSDETVRRFLRSGKLRGVRPGSTKLGWRIPTSEVALFLSGHRQSSFIDEPKKLAA
jgi:excisionase family DNA binding protein